MTMGDKGLGKLLMALLFMGGITLFTTASVRPMQLSEIILVISLGTVSLLGVLIPSLYLLWIKVNSKKEPMVRGTNPGYLHVQKLKI